MNFFEKTLNIIEVVFAIDVKPIANVAVHTKRPSHGLVFIAKSHESVYRFEEGKEIVCNHGDIMYLPKGSSYQNTIRSQDFRLFSENSRMVYCINFLIDEEIDTEPFKLHIKDVEKLKSDFDKAAAAWKKKEIGYEEICRSCLYKIIADCKKAYAKPYVCSKQIKMLEPAIQFIQNEFSSQTLSIPMLAKLCGISETYFRKLFLLEFGISPSKYIRNKRLMLARDLLNSGEFSVSDAAMASGFNDISYFSREYKKLWGVNPSLK